MTRIELSSEEQEILGQILQNALDTLELEIGHSDHQEFKTLLKRRREVLRGLLGKVTQTAEAAA